MELWHLSLCSNHRPHLSRKYSSVDPVLLSRDYSKALLVYRALTGSELLWGTKSLAPQVFHVPVTSVLPTRLCPHYSGPLQAHSSLNEAQLYPIPQTLQLSLLTLPFRTDAEACSILLSPLLSSWRKMKERELWGQNNPSWNPGSVLLSSCGIWVNYHWFYGFNDWLSYICETAGTQ